jgi:hypothetical protein
MIFNHNNFSKTIYAIPIGSRKVKNTIGYDIDVLDIPNALNAVIPMVKHKVPCDLTTTGDGYGAFLRLCC